MRKMKNILREFRDEFKGDQETRKYTYVGIALVLVLGAVAVYYTRIKNPNETSTKPSPLEHQIIHVDLNGDGKPDAELKRGLQYLITVPEQGNPTVQEYHP